jgi:hypothetical protein
VRRIWTLSRLQQVDRRHEINQNSWTTPIGDRVHLDIEPLAKHLGDATSSVRASGMTVIGTPMEPDRLMVFTIDQTSSQLNR